jgi:probable F420-dependent oxidoreductase
MNFGLFFANAGPFAQTETFEALVRKSDDVGIESLWAIEHVVIPVGYESEYPYAKSGRIPGREDNPMSDPLIALGYAAAISSRLRLATGILILPQRHPLYVAKEIATIDLLSNGRAILGVGIGWLEEEFDALGIPFHERAARTDESIRAIRSLWKPGADGFEGEFYRWKPVHSSPRPVQEPGPPIVIGGHVEAAARRAARFGDGFFPAKGGLNRLPLLFDVIRKECAEIGRDPSEIELSASAAATDLDTIRRYQDIGVSRLIISPPGFDPDGIARGLEAFGNDVLAKL